MSVAEVDYAVQRMFAAIEQGDTVAFKACFGPGARIWHNDDEVEQDVDAICAVIDHLHALCESVAYKQQRIVRAGNLCFVQHVLSAKLRSEGTLRVPAMMRIEIDNYGLVSRIEEYYDSRAIDCLK